MWLLNLFDALLVKFPGTEISIRFVQRMSWEHFEYIIIFQVKFSIWNYAAVTVFGTRWCVVLNLLSDTDNDFLFNCFYCFILPELKMWLDVTRLNHLFSQIRKAEDG